MQHVWRILVHVTRVRARPAGLPPSEDPGLLEPCCGRSVRPHGTAGGLAVGRSGRPVRPGLAGRAPADHRRITRDSPKCGTAAGHLLGPASPSKRRGRRSPPRLLARNTPLPCVSVRTDSNQSGPRNHRGRCRRCLMELRIEFIGELCLQRRRDTLGRRSKVADWNPADACERNQLPSRPVPFMVGRQVCGRVQRRSVRHGKGFPARLHIKAGTTAPGRVYLPLGCGALARHTTFHLCPNMAPY